ncbi:MAG TPA: cytochrome c family protein [Stellaceae bacterium]|nr:cytochrome c family protein [Stellaceae bacterium]
MRLAIVAAIVTAMVFCMAFTARTASAADVLAGQTVFNRCKICHKIEANQRSTVGPNLHGIFGRKAGTLDGFAGYSEPMKNAGIVWNDETLGKYLRDPKGFLPGTNMAFPGLKNDVDVANLLAYLHQAAQ